MSSVSLSSTHIKAQAADLGFVACGISPAGKVRPWHASHYLRRIKLGHFAGMDYMLRNVEMRLDPCLLLPGVKSIVSLALNYMPHRQQRAISLYAQGRDYHDVMRERLQTLMQRIGASGRCFVDTAPVMERYWAWRGGVGHFCRNGLIAVPGYGPTVFLGELFLMEETDAYDKPLDDGEDEQMGWTSLCPALTPEGLDARLCLSYLTIEHRGELPADLRLTSTFYGCDRCLRSCPEFRDARPTDEPAFQPSEPLLAMDEQQWRTMTVEQYRDLFRGSAVKRAKYEGLQRNINKWTPT